jgi:hypothetical protein
MIASRARKIARHLGLSLPSGVSVSVFPAVVEHEMYHHGVEDREMAEEGLKGAHDIRVSLPFLQGRRRS